jgi:hypothetical protein
VVLEVTAKNDKGEKIFSEQKVYIQYGQDVDGDMRTGAWQIKKFVDFTLQPLEVRHEKFAISVPEGTKAADVEIVLKYNHPGAKIEIPIGTVARKIEFKD